MILINRIHYIKKLKYEKYSKNYGINDKQYLANSNEQQETKKNHDRLAPHVRCTTIIIR